MWTNHQLNNYVIDFNSLQKTRPSCCSQLHLMQVFCKKSINKMTFRTHSIGQTQQTVLGSN